MAIAQGNPRCLEFVNGERLAEVRQEKRSRLNPWQADGLVKEMRRDVVSSCNCREGKGLLVKSFGIEQQAVHVEDDGSGNAGEFRAKGHSYVLSGVRLNTIH